MSEPALKCEKNAIFKQIYTLKQLIAFKMAYCCFFSLGEIKIFQISSKKSFIKLTPETCLSGEKRRSFSIFEKRFDLNKRTNDLITCDRMLNSVTRWLDYLSIFIHLKISRIMSQICQNWLAFCQIRKKHTKIDQKLVNFCQSGEILPNLVTLS